MNPLRTKAETTEELLRGRTRGEIGEAAGLPTSTTYPVLAGKVWPSLPTALLLSQALGVTLDRFARAWVETRRRREEREASRAAALAAIRAFGKDTS